MCGSGGRVAPLVFWEGDSIVGELAGDEDDEVVGEEWGEAIDAVERRDAAIVKRRCDSVLSVAVMTHPNPVISICIIQSHAFQSNSPGHPLVQHHSSSSPKKHCSHTNAPRASPENASSKSAFLVVQSAACASDAARRKSCTTGMVSAWRRSRWRSHVGRVWSSPVESWKAQKLTGNRVSWHLEQ
jgi:hypothetical protein